MERINVKSTFVSKVALLFLGINLVAGFLWVFNIHTLRLLLLAFSGFALFVVAIFHAKNKLAFHVIFYLCLLFFFSFLINFSLNDYQLFLIDISAIGIIISVFSLTGLNNKLLKNGIVFMIILTILYFAYTLPFMDLSIIRSGIYNRTEAFNSYGYETSSRGISKGYIIYSTQQLAVSCLITSLLLLPIIYKQVNKSFTIAFVILAFIFIITFSVFYQKRQQFVELILCVILSFLFYRKLLPGLIPKNKLFSITVLILFIILIFSSDIVNNILIRFSETFSNLKEFDRLEESINVFSDFNIVNWIFGKGFGYAAPDTPGAIILHIGYSNLLMKGGLIVLLFYLFQTFKNIRYCKRKAKQYPEFNIGIAISIFSLIQLIYSPGYHWFVPSLIMGLAMFSRYPLKTFIYDKYSNSSS